MERKYPLLSIIIPVYNTERFLRRCINSVLGQTYSPIEIILVNDGSPDDSDEIIFDYVNRYDNIVYVKNEDNQGLFQARLRGYEKASGTYIASLDSDDFVGSDYYRIQMLNAIESSADIVMSTMTLYYQNNGEKTQRTYGNYAIRNIELCGKEIKQAFFSTDAEVSQWWFVWNKVYRKTLWDKCYKNLALYKGHHIMLEDFVYGIVFMTNAEKIISIENDTYYYVRHEESSTGKSGGIFKIKKNVNDILDAFAFLKNYLEQIGETKEGLLFLEKARRRWKKTWVASVTNANIGEECKKEIISKLEEMSVGVETDKYNHIYAGYFYRELNSCLEETEKLKEYIKNTKIKLVCIETKNVLFDEIWDLDELLDNVEIRWKKDNKEDISDIIFNRKWSERMLLREDTDTYNFHVLSLQEIYDGIKKVESPEYNHLVDLVQRLEEKIRKKYIFVRKNMDEVISFAKWLGKEIIIINTSPIQVDLADYARCYTLNKNFLPDICRDFECNISEILYFGANKSVDLARLSQTYGVKCHEVKVVSDIKGDILKKNNLSNESALRLLNNEGKNGIKETLLDLVCEQALYRKTEDSLFLSDPFLIGSVIGSHVVSVVGWLLNIALKRKKKEICFWGNNAEMYYKALTYILEKQNIELNISSSMRVFSEIEKALEWVIYPDTFVEQDVMCVDVTVSNLLDMLSKFVGDIPENILRRYGISREDKIDNFILCERLHCILDFDLDVLSQLEKIFFDGIKNDILLVCADKKAESIIKRYATKENVIACIYYNNQSGLIRDKETYYSTERIIDYPIRPFLTRDVLNIKCEEIYPTRFIVDNLKKGIQSYMDIYFNTFEKDFIEYLPLYSEQDSYYFEKLLYFPSKNDRLLFDVIQLCDYESNKVRLLSNIWWEKLDKSLLLKKKEKSKKEKPLDKLAVYYKGEKRSYDDLSILERQMIYWIFDKRKINYKVRKYWFSRVLLCPLLKFFGKTIKQSKHCLYIATSNYNLLCCIIHKLKYNADKDCDLFLSVWRKDKVDLLKMEGLFKNIYISEDNHFRNMTRELDGKIDHVSKKEKDYLVEGFYDRFCDEIPINLFEYKSILATNTIMPITVVLQKLHIPYDCVEEAAGLYSNNELLLNNMRNFHPKSEVYALEKYKMLNMDHVKGKRFVNVSAQETNYSRRRVVDFNVVSELKKMDDEKRTKILSIFSSTEAVRGESKLSCLMLTYPLASRCGLSEKEHIEVYRLLMDIFCKDMVVHFKPHPDDSVDYTKYFINETNFKLINKQVLSELLEFETKTKYQKAITTVSTSTNNLQNCEEKIVFGKEFEKEYKYLLLCFGYYLVIQKICQPEKYVVYFMGVDKDIIKNIFCYSVRADKKYVVYDSYENAADEEKPKIWIIKSMTDYTIIGENDVAVTYNTADGYEKIHKNHTALKLVMNINGRETNNRYLFTVLIPQTVTLPLRFEVSEYMERCGYEISIVEEKIKTGKEKKK